MIADTKTLSADTPMSADELARDMPEVRYLDAQAGDREETYTITPTVIDPNHGHNSNNHGGSKPVPKPNGDPMLSAEQYEAYLNTRLFAELYGTGTLYFGGDPKEEQNQFPIDVRKKTDLWYMRYTRVLPLLAWSASKIAWEDQSGSSGSFKVDTQLLRILVELGATEVQKKAFLAFLADAEATYKQSKENIELFGIREKDSNKGEFEISTPELDRQGAVTTKTLYLSVESNVSIQNILFFNLDRSKSKIYSGSQNLTLSWNIYQRKKAWIEDAVANYQPEVKRLNKG